MGIQGIALLAFLLLARRLDMDGGRVVPMGSASPISNLLVHGQISRHNSGELAKPMCWVLFTYASQKDFKTIQEGDSADA